MTNKSHNDELSIAVDNALLKLSKDYNFSLPKDDYVLAQLFLNREILCEMFSIKTEELNSENLKSKKFFRDALAMLTKQHNEKIKELNSKSERLEKQVKISIVISTASILLSSLLITLMFIGG